MTAAGPLRGPQGMKEAGPAAADFSVSPRRVRGRSSGLKGAAHRAARDSPAGCAGPRRPRRPLGGRKSGQARACPAGRAARNPRPAAANAGEE